LGYVNGIVNLRGRTTRHKSTWKDIKINLKVRGGVRVWTGFIWLRIVSSCDTVMYLGVSIQAEKFDPLSNYQLLNKDSVRKVQDYVRLRTTGAITEIKGIMT
jgi:hypothetical protein